MISPKKLEQIEKLLGKEFALELQGLAPEAIKEKVVQAEQAMKEASEELEANPKYQELKESLKALSEGKKEVNKRQKAIIAYALHLLDN
jgi:hypothetical protein